MNEWFYFCALSGLALGIGWPVQILLAVAAVALPAGFVYQLHAGLGVALLASILGVIILQVSYILSSRISTVLSQMWLPSFATRWARSKH